MRAQRLAILAVAASLAACSEGPFIDQGIQVTVDKPTNTIPLTGQVAVCYGGDTPFTEVEALAAEACAAYGLQPQLRQNLRFQCRITAPHRAAFRCIHPDMRDKDGSYLNPMDRSEVEDWKRRTGNRTAPGGLGTKVPGTVAPSADAPPPAVEPAPPPPAAIPRSVPVPPAPTAPTAEEVNPPRPLPPPPAAPIGAPSGGTSDAAPAEGGFTLPVGTWGDAFDAR